MTPLTYRGAGVDSAAGNRLVQLISPLVRATSRPGCAAIIGSFGGFFDMKEGGFSDPVLVASTDGVGTKVRIAIETGQHSTIGIDLVAMSVNDVVAEGAEPLFFLDYFSTGKASDEVVTQVIAGIVSGCREAKCALLGGEIAQMPGLHEPNAYELAGFAVGAVERGALLSKALVRSGDLVVGLPSSGFHSEGFSLVREVVRMRDLSWGAPAPFAPHNTLGDALLAPSKIYVRPCLDVIRKTKSVRALAHITGGGLPAKISRIVPVGLTAVIDLEQIPVPPACRWLANEGNISEREMLNTFNCGIGMVMVVDPNAAKEIHTILGEYGEAAIKFGKIVFADRDDSPRVIFSGHLDLGVRPI